MYTPTMSQIQLFKLRSANETFIWHTEILYTTTPAHTHILFKSNQDIFPSSSQRKGGDWPTYKFQLSVALWNI